MQIEVVWDSLRHDAGIDAIVNGINLIYETLAIAQQKVLYIAKATILHNDHQLTCLAK